MLNAHQLFRVGTRFLDTNAPAILTAFGSVGVVGTAVLTAKATFKSATEIFEENRERANQADIDGGNSMDESIYLDKVETFKLVWINYLPAATVGVASIAAIVMSNRISSKRAAALAVAYAMNQDKLDEYQEKVKEKLGVKKEEEVRTQVHQDKINSLGQAGFDWANPAFGKVWVVEAYTGRPFLSTIETVNKAVNEVNAECNREGSVRLSEFYETLGFDQTQAADYFGFNRHEPLEVSWTTGTSPDGSIPVHIFEYVNHPIPDPGGASFR